MRKIKFKNNEYYHILNRGVDKREVFSGKQDYLRFLKSMKEFNVLEPIGSLYEKYCRDKRENINGSSASIMEVELLEPKLVEIVCYCLNPNHYHLLLRQSENNGIEKFMHRLGTGYTKYFNQRNKRNGSLFQGRFKAIHIDSNEYLLYLSAYINKNYFIHGYEGNDWEYSSLMDYLGKRNGKLCDKRIILSQFDNIEQYKDFLEKNALHLKNRKEEEKYLME